MWESEDEARVAGDGGGEVRGRGKERDDGEVRGEECGGAWGWVVGARGFGPDVDWGLAMMGG